MNEKNNRNQKKLSKDYRLFAKNSFYSFLYSYSAFFLSLITSFLMARMISQEIWGYLILATSYVTIFQLFLLFFPPSLGLSLNYYIPKFKALKQNGILKSFVSNSIYLRIIFTFLIFFASIIIYYLFIDLFRITLHDYSYLFLVLSPLILIQGLNKVFSDIIRALNKFNIVFILLIVQYLLYILGLTFYLFFYNVYDIGIIALIIVYSQLIPSLLTSFIIFELIFIKIRRSEKVSYKETVKNLYSFGIHLSINSFITSYFKQFRIQSIGLFSTPESVLGFNIGNNYNSFTFEAIRSFNSPLTISFSNLYAKENYEKVQKIYRISFKYSIFLILIMSGFLFFISDIFLSLIYGQNYLSYSLILKLMVISIIFNIQEPYFYSLLRGSNKVKYVIPTTLVVFSLRLSFFIIGLIFYGIIGAIIIGIFAVNIVLFFIIGVLNYKVFRIKQNIKTHILQYLIFFISLTISLILEGLFFRDINFFILKSLNLLIFKHFNIFSLVLFLLIYFFLNLIFRIFLRKDLEYLKALFAKENRSFRLIRWFLNFLEKFTLK